MTFRLMPLEKVSQGTLMSSPFIRIGEVPTIIFLFKKWYFAASFPFFTTLQISSSTLTLPMPKKKKGGEIWLYRPIMGIATTVSVRLCLSHGHGENGDGMRDSSVFLSCIGKLKQKPLVSQLLFQPIFLTLKYN